MAAKVQRSRNKAKEKTLFIYKNHHITTSRSPKNPSLLLPPVITNTAKGLHDTVHGLALSDSDGLIGTAIMVMPRGDKKEAAFRSIKATRDYSQRLMQECVCLDGNMVYASPTVLLMIAAPPHTKLCLRAFHPLIFI